MIKDRCIVAYGFNDDEIKKLKIYVTGVKEVSNNMLDLKIKDIIKGETEGNYVDEPFNEKVVLFNSYPDNEVRSAVKKLREVFPGIILAMVTPLSINWSFKYLMSHLLQEKEMEKNNMNGR